jgi:hypothetical protein
MKHLESWWSTLEEGMPKLETKMESHPEQEGLAKRKRDFSKRDKDREREVENARECARDIIEEVI